MINGFEYPYFLLLLVIIPLLIAFQIFYDKKQYSNIHYSQLTPFEGYSKSWRVKLRLLPNYLRYLVLALLIIAIARPQSYLSKDEMNIEGVDIVVALDISGSMLAEDFKPNRLEAAKDVAKDFMQGRQTDNIGLVVFSGEAFTQCPPTTDHRMLLELTSKVESGIIEDGTAIGDGLATAINRMKDTKTKSKTIILLTDGVNNMGAIDPLTAAEIAKDYKMRVYTIGIGKIGMAPYPFQTPFGKQYQNVEVNIDEPLLKEISNITGGKYFRSTDKNSLQTIFKEIDSMEKSIIDVSYYKLKKDLALPFLIGALLVLIAEVLLRRTILRTNP
ncbi:MAG: VWA domain-containing protein [Bacteroidales bacterium]|jgi:Ca-activated chloride channel family protein|nr:VWA domain-containing protein [Bacteroidales bacterium]MDD4703509.1 VWA domain-containing protein [Bacteroidales bacterium]MDX9798091.1 VWA domain-containing protein [Bacteroidales bacterium]